MTQSAMLTHRGATERAADRRRRPRAPPLLRSTSPSSLLHGLAGRARAPARGAPASSSSRDARWASAGRVPSWRRSRASRCRRRVRGPPRRGAANDHRRCRSSVASYVRGTGQATGSDPWPNDAAAPSIRRTHRSRLCRRRGRTPRAPSSGSCVGVPGPGPGAQDRRRRGGGQSVPRVAHIGVDRRRIRCALRGPTADEPHGRVSLRDALSVALRADVRAEHRRPLLAARLLCRRADRR
jgi:hypothetical protein